MVEEQKIKEITMSSLTRNDEGILTKMAGQAEKNIKSGAKWAGKQAKKGLATLGKKAAYGAGKLVKKGIDAFKKGPTHTVGESTMNVYERILNILLEARVDMFIQDRLDEAKLKGKQGKLDVNKNKKLDAEDFKMLRSGKRSDESKNSLKTREFMKSWKGQAAKTASSGSDPAIKAKKLDRAGKMRKAGNASGARAEIAKSQKLDKPQLP